MGVCVFASAGLCLVAGVVYAGADYLAAVHDANGNWGNRQALTGLAINLATTAVSGYGGKALGGFLGSTSADEASEAFSLTRGWAKSPYLSRDLLGVVPRAVAGTDVLFTSMVLGINAAHSIAQCYVSFSQPCD
jgi:hypothetical protein